jgi:co-chaperonin GroES (HSP10)
MTDLNHTGIVPTEYNVLVRIDRTEEKTVGGIILPEEKQDRDQAFCLYGMMIDASPHAFSYENWSGHEDKMPKVGDRVMIAKAAGLYVNDLGDGEKYRLLKDKDIIAVANNQPKRTIKAVTEPKRLKVVPAGRAISAV